MGDNILAKTTSVFPESVMGFNVLTGCSLQPPGPALPSWGLFAMLCCSSPRAEGAPVRNCSVWSVLRGWV